MAREAVYGLACCPATRRPRGKIMDHSCAANLPGFPHYRRFTAKQRLYPWENRVMTCGFTVGSSSSLRGVATVWVRGWSWCRLCPLATKRWLLFWRRVSGSGMAVPRSQCEFEDGERHAHVALRLSRHGYAATTMVHRVAVAVWAPGTSLPHPAVAAPGMPHIP